MAPRGPSLLNYGLLLSGCLATLLLYLPGFPADWTFDAQQNIQGLGSVVDPRTALAFITGNAIAGFGRPLSMASFLLNVSDWPEHPEGFRLVNVLIHVVNGVLVAIAAYMVARQIPRLQRRAAGFSVALATLWMVHPFLASTSLFVVQRMTLLAATFTLLGLTAYLHGRTLLAAQPKRGYIWMSSALVVGSALGFLAKENGALLPLFAGAIEFAVLSVYVPVQQRVWLGWRVLFFLGPIVAITAYFGWTWRGQIAGYDYQPFTLGERLLSEPVILLQYVQQILVPNVAKMGPFQDDTARILQLGPLSVISTIVWLTLLVAAFVLRRRASALSFAVLFFLAGHLLESSVFPLELYFEHRNYIPSLGILGGVLGVAWAVEPRWPRLLGYAITAAFAFLLWQVTSTWGNPAEAARLWSSQHPTSTRATQYLATSYQREGNFRAMASVVYEHYRRTPENASLAIQVLVTQCLVANAEGYSLLMQEVTARVPQMPYRKDAVTNLHNLITLTAQGQCKAASVSDIRTLTNALAGNSVFDRRPTARYGLLVARGRIESMAGDAKSAAEHLREAFDMEPNLGLAESIVGLLVRSNEIEQALQFLDHAEEKQTFGSPTVSIWHERIQALRREIQSNHDAPINQPDHSRQE